MTGSLIECPCGVVLRATSRAEVVKAAQSHAKAVHDLELTEEQAEAMARPN